jgi:lipopolysaccharide export system protein LptA
MATEARRGWRPTGVGRKGGAMIRWTAIVAGMTTATLALTPLAPAWAQIGEKSGAPIDITADEAEVVNSKCLAIWRGAAEALQADTRLRANTISVYSVPKGVNAGGQASCGGTDRIVADGQVFYVTPTQNARADHAVYSQSADQIILTGNVIVVQGNNVARGDKLTIQVSTKEARMESKVTGLGKPGRVRAVVYPDKSTQSGAAQSSAVQTTPSALAKP